MPVLTIPILDESGNAINSENDDIVCLLQEALQAETVIQMIEAPGFLEDANNPSSVRESLSREELAQKEEQVSGRMKRKLHALNKLAKGNVKKIIICDGRTQTPITDALNGEGTWIQ